MGKTGNCTGVHLHYEIRKHTNVYNQTIDASFYMQVPNKNGVYNSRNFEVNIKSYEVGSTVYLPCKFTGAVQGNTSLIQINNSQMWVYTSGLSKDKSKIRAIVCYEDVTKIMIEIDSLLDSNKQFWVNKYEVI